MSLSPKSQVMLASAFSCIADFFVFLGFIFLSYGDFKMHEIKLRVQVMRPALASSAWSLAIGRRGVITMLECHCRKGKPQC